MSWLHFLPGERMLPRLAFALLVCLAAILPPVAPMAVAQVPGIPAPAGTNGTEPAPPPAPTDPLGRDTPEGLLKGLLRALAAQDLGKAAQYMDVKGVPAWQRRGITDRQYAAMLQQVLDQAGWVDGRWEISDKPTGNNDDGLPPGIDRIGAVRTTSGKVDLLAARIEGRGPVPIWLISAQTVAKLPELVSTAVAGPLEQILPDVLTDTRTAGAPIGHWLALLVLAGLAYLVAMGVSRAIRWTLPRLLRQVHQERATRLFEAAESPVRVLIMVALFLLGALALGVSIVARQRAGIGAEVIAWLALGWLAWRMVDTVTKAGIVRASARGHFAAVSVMTLLRKTGQVALIALAVILCLDSLGVNVTAGLAALGIGGIAIALGAQKTVENFIGSLTLIADQPIRVGDFCRFEGILGTVEDIGIRSSRIRTLDRTVVTVPNSQMASIILENFTRRDRFWYHPRLTMRYETTPDQMRYLLVRLRELLYAHPCISPDPARVRFVGFGSESLDIDIFAFMVVKDYDQFLEVQEDLALRIMDVVREAGCSFAFPSRTLYLGRNSAADPASVQAAEAQAREWIGAGELPLPNFPEARIAALRNTIEYPPKPPAPGQMAR